jgi:hypothetical protein
VTQACERQETKPMRFFHVGERLCAAPDQLCGFLMSDFPDKRLPYHLERIPYHRTAPHDDMVEFTRFNVAAYGVSILSCCNTDKSRVIF